MKIELVYFDILFFNTDFNESILHSSEYIYLSAAVITDLDKIT
jgi:hypothetical protein